MDDVYVVMYLGTPVGVYFSREDAKELRERMKGEVVSPEEYRIVATSIQDIKTWIQASMRRAIDSDTTGTPVVIPSEYEAFYWMVSEVGEAAGASIGAQKDWKRNHPEKHLQDSYAKELSQVILMAVLSSIESPIAGIRRQLKKWGDKTN